MVHMITEIQLDESFILNNKKDSEDSVPGYRSVNNLSKSHFSHTVFLQVETLIVKRTIFFPRYSLLFGYCTEIFELKYLNRIFDGYLLIKNTLKNRIRDL